MSSIRNNSGLLATSACLVGLFFAISPAAAFFNGQTGVVSKQLKNACPAFASGDYTLADTSAVQTGMILADIFEHESGARCMCSRSKSEKNARCGPTAPRRDTPVADKSS
jgi:hypothetical protein